MGLYRGYIGYILGLYWGYTGYILGLYRGYIGYILGLGGKRFWAQGVGSRGSELLPYHTSQYIDYLGRCMFCCSLGCPTAYLSYKNFFRRSLGVPQRASSMQSNIALAVCHSMLALSLKHYLQGHGDLVTRLVTPTSHIMTPSIPIISLLPKPPLTLQVATS